MLGHTQEFTDKKPHKTSKETALENRIKELETAILSARDSLDSLDSVFAKLVSKALMQAYLKGK